MKLCTADEHKMFKDKVVCKQFRCSASKSSYLAPIAYKGHRNQLLNKVLTIEGQHQSHSVYCGQKEVREHFHHLRKDTRKIFETSDVVVVEIFRRGDCKFCP